jgi:hypothetical protein
MNNKAVYIAVISALAGIAIFAGGVGFNSLLDKEPETFKPVEGNVGEYGR